MLGLDYIRTARAKGLERALRGPPPRRCRNAMLPVVTIIGLQLGGLLGGAVLTETSSTWPASARPSTRRSPARDYVVIQGFTLVIAIGYLVVNLLVDISYAFLDPRVRLSMSDVRR